MLWRKYSLERPSNCNQIPPDVMIDGTVRIFCVTVRKSMIASATKGLPGLQVGKNFTRCFTCISVAGSIERFIVDSDKCRQRFQYQGGGWFALWTTNLTPSTPAELIFFGEGCPLVIRSQFGSCILPCARPPGPCPLSTDRFAGTLHRLALRAF